MSRSALISAANIRYSSPVHSTFIRHLSILLPHVVSVSPRHSVKSVPHSFCIHWRRPMSHAFWPRAVAFWAADVAVSIASRASSSARCCRIISANASEDVSVSDVDAPDKIASNCNDLFSITSVGSASGVGSGSGSGSVSDSDSDVDVVDWLIVVNGIRPVIFVRVATVGRDVPDDVVVVAFAVLRWTTDAPTDTEAYRAITAVHTVPYKICFDWQMFLFVFFIYFFAVPVNSMFRMPFRKIRTVIWPWHVQNHIRRHTCSAYCVHKSFRYMIPAQNYRDTRFVHWPIVVRGPVGNCEQLRLITRPRSQSPYRVKTLWMS